MAGLEPVMGRAGNRGGRTGGTAMRAACISMALLAGSLLNRFLPGEAFYKTPLLLVPAGLFYTALAVGILKEKPSLKKIGFYLCHAGLLAVAVGALLFWGLGREVTFHIPIGSEQAYGEVQTEEDGLVSFGFSICVPRFEPVYTGEAVSQYRAELRLIGGGQDETRPIQVNSPVRHGGWKFYLMDYDHEAQSYVTLHAKKDPGNRLFAAGLWMVLIGTYLMCFRIGSPRPGGGTPRSPVESGQRGANEREGGNLKNRENRPDGPPNSSVESVWDGVDNALDKTGGNDSEEGGAHGSA